MSFLKDIFLLLLALVTPRLGHKIVLYVERPPKALGGPRSFMRLLVARLKSKGDFQITHNRMVRSDVALVLIGMNENHLKRFHSRGTKIIQRLDGLFYDKVSLEEDNTLNHEARITYKNYADGVLFQSEYSRKQVQSFFGVPKPDVKSAIVINGTDLDLFRPNEAKIRDSNQLRLVMTGNFRDKEMIVPVIKALELLRDRYDFILTIIGPIAEIDWLGSSLNDLIIRHRSLASHAIAEELRNSHAFVFSFLNPNCPNSVIEAVASGLPVVSFNSGSMSELCPFNTSILADVRSSLLNKVDDLDPRALAKVFEDCFLDYSSHREISLRNRELWGIKKAVDGYSDFIKEVLDD